MHRNKLIDPEVLRGTIQSSKATMLTIRDEMLPPRYVASFSFKNRRNVLEYQDLRSQAKATRVDFMQRDANDVLIEPAGRWAA